MRSQGWVYISSEVTYRLSPRDLCKRHPPTPFPPNLGLLEGRCNREDTCHLGATACHTSPRGTWNWPGAPEGRPGKRLENAPRATAPRLHSPGTTHLSCDCTVHAGGEGLQTHVHHCDRAENPIPDTCEVSGTASLALPHFVLVSILWGRYDSNFIGETEA